jgi:hypothetical protein
MPIRWMVDAVIGRDIWNGKRIYSLKAADVVSVLLGIGPPLMVGVDATIAAEVVLGGVSIELIELKVLSAFDDADAAQGNGSNDCTLAPANGAIATSRVDDAIREI